MPVSMFVSKNSYLNLVLALECWYKDSKHVCRSPVGDEERTRPEWVEDTLSVLSFIVMFVNFYIARPKYCYVHLWFDTHTHLKALFPGLPGWAGTRKVKPIWIFLKQETVSGSGISWAICKSAPCCRQITMPAPHHSVFYRPDALPVAQPGQNWFDSCD